MSVKGGLSKGESERVSRQKGKDSGG
jgi:hypothetical protein